MDLWVKNEQELARDLVHAFKDWIDAHKTENPALRKFFGQVFLRRGLTVPMLDNLVDKLQSYYTSLPPLGVWKAYQKLGTGNGQPFDAKDALIGLIRWQSGTDSELTTFRVRSDERLTGWLQEKKYKTGIVYDQEQMQWLQMIKEFIDCNLHIEKADLGKAPFPAHGGWEKMSALFGQEASDILFDLNEALAPTY